VVDITDGRLGRSPGPLAAFVAGGLTSLLPLGRAHGASAAALVLAPAAALAALVAVQQRRGRERPGSGPGPWDDDAWRDLPAPVVPVVAGVVVATGSALGILVDRAEESVLRRRGVRRPRVVIALVGAVGSAALAVLDRRPPVSDGLTA